MIAAVLIAAVLAGAVVGVVLAVAALTVGFEERLKGF